MRSDIFLGRRHGNFQWKNDVIPIFGRVFGSEGMMDFRDFCGFCPSSKSPPQMNGTDLCGFGWILSSRSMNLCDFPGCCCAPQDKGTIALLGDYVCRCEYIYRLSKCTFHGLLFFMFQTWGISDHYHHITLGFGKCLLRWFAKSVVTQQEEPHFDFAPW